MEKRSFHRFFNAQSKEIATLRLLKLEIIEIGNDFGTTTANITGNCQWCGSCTGNITATRANS